MDHMKALVAPCYGGPDVLHIKTVPVPRPAHNEILVKVVASSVNRTDTGILSGKPLFARLVFGLMRPRRQILGTEFAGVVESVGASRTEFNVGDRVFGFHDEGTSAHAEFLTVSDREAIALIPPTIDFHVAAVCSEGPFYAFNLLRNVAIGAGDRALINGVSGSIGSAILQLLKQREVHVTGICPAAATAQISQLGADVVHDCQETALTSFDNQEFDFVLDTVGNQSYTACRKHLNNTGTYASTELGPWCQNVIHAMAAKLSGNRRAIFPIPRDVKACQRKTIELLSAESYRPLVDRCYPFEQIVDAYRYVSTGMKTGNVVVTFDAAS